MWVSASATLGVVTAVALTFAGIFLTSPNEALELLISAVRARNPADGRLTQAPQVTLRLGPLTARVADRCRTPGR